MIICLIGCIWGRLSWRRLGAQGRLLIVFRKFVLTIPCYEEGRASAKIGQVMQAGPAPSIDDRLEDGSRVVPPVVARVSVFDTLAAVAGAWHRLERLSPLWPYRSFALADAWLTTIGQASGRTAAILVAEDAAGRPLALLPLAVRRRAGLRSAEFIGRQDFNGHLGFFDPAVAWDRGSVEAILWEGGRRAGIDVYRLIYQRPAWAGLANPLALLGGQPSASFGHTTDLAADPETFFRHRLSKHARKGLRSKRTKLQALGAVRHMTARTEAEATTILDRYLEQKSERFERMGVKASSSPRAHHAFLHEVSNPEGPSGAVVELHALQCGDRIVATFGGTGGPDRFSGLFISFDADEVYARCSPGDQLLAAVIQQKCLDGCRSFDLGIGEARYKESFCPEVEPLFDQFIGITVAGRAWAAIDAALARGKRLIKQTPWLWSAARRGRKLISGGGQSTRSHNGS